MASISQKVYDELMSLKQSPEWNSIHDDDKKAIEQKYSETYSKIKAKEDANLAASNYNLPPAVEAPKVDYVEPELSPSGGLEFAKNAGKSFIRIPESMVSMGAHGLGFAVSPFSTEKAKELHDFGKAADLVNQQYAPSTYKPVGVEDFARIKDAPGILPKLSEIGSLFAKGAAAAPEVLGSTYMISGPGIAAGKLAQAAGASEKAAEAIGKIGMGLASTDIAGGGIQAKEYDKTGKIAPVKDIAPYALGSGILDMGMPGTSEANVLKEGLKKVEKELTKKGLKESLESALPTFATRAWNGVKEGLPEVGQETLQGISEGAYDFRDKGYLGSLAESATNPDVLADNVFQGITAGLSAGGRHVFGRGSDMATQAEASRQIHHAAWTGGLGPDVQASLIKKLSLLDENAAKLGFDLYQDDVKNGRGYNLGTRIKDALNDGQKLNIIKPKAATNIEKNVTPESNSLEKEQIEKMGYIGEMLKNGMRPADQGVNDEVKKDVWNDPSIGNNYAKTLADALKKAGEIKPPAIWGDRPEAPTQKIEEETPDKTEQGKPQQVQAQVQPETKSEDELSLLDAEELKPQQTGSVVQDYNPTPAGGLDIDNMKGRTASIKRASSAGETIITRPPRMTSGNTDGNFESAWNVLSSEGYVPDSLDSDVVEWRKPGSVGNGISPLPVSAPSSQLVMQKSEPSIASKMAGSITRKFQPAPQEPVTPGMTLPQRKEFQITPITDFNPIETEKSENVPNSPGYSIHAVNGGFQVRDSSGKAVFASSTKEAAEKWIIRKMMQQPTVDPAVSQANQSSKPIKPIKTEEPISQPTNQNTPLVGKVMEVYSPSHKKAKVQFRVVDARDLITSFDEKYNQELQPRNRDKLASKVQIESIGIKPIPEKLISDHAEADVGTPIVGSDLMVESGNGRTEGIRQAYKNGTAGAYRKYLIENASRFGIDPTALKMVGQPVLIRERISTLDTPARREWAKDLNRDSKLQMSAAESAVSDVDAVTPILHRFAPAENGDLQTTANTGFLRDFFGRIMGPGDDGRFMTEDGALTQDGVFRVKRAIFAAAYGNPKAVEIFSDDASSDIKTVVNGLNMAAPKMAEVRKGSIDGKYFPLDISSTVAEAMTKLASLKSVGETLDGYLRQLTLFDDGVSEFAKDIMQMFEQNRRSAKAIKEILNKYNDEVMKYGDPRQGRFEEVELPSKTELFKKVVDKYERKQDPQGNFDSLTGASGSTEPDGNVTGGPEKPGAVGGIRETQEGNVPVQSVPSGETAGAGGGGLTQVSSSNVFVTDARAEEIRKKIRSKLSQINSGVDPELFALGAELGAYYVERGARKFAAFAEAMVADLGEKIRKYLPAIYAGVRNFKHMGLDVSGMDDESVVDAHVLKSRGISDSSRTSNQAQQTETIDIGTPGNLKIRNLPKVLVRFIEENFDPNSDQKPADNPKLKKWIASMMPQVSGEEETNHKIIQEAFEGAMALYVINHPNMTEEQLNRLYRWQPNMNFRSGMSVANQAYSTPINLASFVGRALNVSSSDKILEPTAGTGLLVSGVAKNQSNISLNEINETRLEVLQGVFPKAEISSANALDGFGKKLYDVVIANPPFGNIDPIPVQTEGSAPTKTAVRSIDHAIAWKALEAMKDNGRAVLIMGAEKNQEITGKNRSFMTLLYNQFNIPGHFEVDGDLYSRQGAAWPITVIFISGRKSWDGNFGAEPPRSVPRCENWGEVQDFTKKIGAAYGQAQKDSDNDSGRNDADIISKPSDNIRGNEGGAPAASGTSSNQHGESISGKGNGRGTGRGLGTGAPVSSPRTGNVSSGSSDRPISHGEVSDGGVRKDQVGSGDTGTPISDRKPGARSESPGELGGGDGSGETRITDRKDTGVGDVEAKETLQAPYFNTAYLVPKYLKNAIESAVTRLEDVEDMSPEDFVKKELGMTDKQFSTAFFPAQTHAVALAISAAKSGNGIVNADQTGVGKGRTAAAMIAWATRNGMIPVFLTEKPNLFTDLYRDLRGVGFAHIRPFITNDKGEVSGEDGKTIIHRPATKSKDYKSVLNRMSNGDLSDFGKNGKYDAIMTTYSQFQNGNKDRIKAFLGLKNILVILDEAHNAAGEEEGNTASFIAKLISPERAKAVYYLSATWAKRPESMRVYYRAIGGDPDALAGAFDQGGIGMQEMVVSGMAAKGRYVRRELDFSQTEWQTKITTDPEEAKREVAIADKVTDGMRGIFDLSEAVVQALKDKGFRDTIESLIPPELGIEDQINWAKSDIRPDPRFSGLFNFIEQITATIKAKRSADRVIELVKEGKKPFVALRNTQESGIDKLIDEAKDGESFSGNIADLIRIMMEKATTIELQAKIANEKGQRRKIRIRIPYELLPRSAKAEYAKMENVISELSEKLNDIPFSPIDYIRSRVEKAGYRVVEITGRTKYLDYNDLNQNGNPKIKTRSGKDKTPKGRNESIAAFNNGDAHVLIGNESAAAGLSIHSSKDFEDQRQRVMLITQPLLDINDFMQILGRIFRTGGVYSDKDVTKRRPEKLGLPATYGKPIFEYIQSSLDMEKRPAAMLENKMKSLNAQTSSNREGHHKLDAVDIFNKYGSEIAGRWLDAHPEEAAVMELDDSEKRTGVDIIVRRLAVMPTSVQKDFWDTVIPQYVDHIEYLNSIGKNDLVPVSMADANARTLNKTEIMPSEEALSSPVYVETMEIEVPGKPVTIVGAKGKAKPVSDAELQKLDKTYNRFIEFAKKKNADREADGKTPTFNIGKIESLSSYTRNRITDYLKPGTKIEFLLPSDDEMVADAIGIVTGFSFAEKENTNPYLPSNVKISIATPLSAGEIKIPLSLLVTGDKGNSASFETRWEKMFSENQTRKETRKFLTGDVMRATGVFNGRATVVRFGRADGTSEYGWLLPKNAAMSDLLAPPEKATIETATAAINKDQIVSSGDGLAVRILKSGEDGPYLIQVRKGSVGKSILGDSVLEKILKDGGQKEAFRLWGTSKTVFYATTNSVATIKAAINRIIEIGDSSGFDLVLPRKNLVNSEASFSRRGSMESRSSLPKSKIEKIAATFSSRLASPSIMVIQSTKDLAKALKEESGKDTVVASDAEGAYFNGKVFLVADNLKSESGVRRVLSHEIIGHLGVPAVVGPAKWKKMIGEINGLAISNPVVRLVAGIVRKNYGDLSPDAMADEIMAHFAGAMDSEPDTVPEKISQLIQDTLDSVREWIEGHLPFLKSEFGVRDLSRVLRLSRLNLQSSASKDSVAKLLRGESVKLEPRTIEVPKSEEDNNPEPPKPTKGIDPWFEEVPEIPFSYAGPRAKDFEVAQREGRVFKGRYDGKPRFEIDDSKAEWNVAGVRGDTNFGDILAGVPMRDGAVRLGDLVEHTELFDNYPDLFDIPVETLPSSSKSLGEADNAGSFPRIAIREDLQSSQAKSTLFHEIQHVIQKTEGFARGGNPDEMYREQMKGEAFVSELNEQMAEIRREMNTESDPEKLKTLRAEYDDVLNRRGNIIEKFRLTLTPEEAYRNLAGEIESRDVSSRLVRGTTKRDQNFEKASELARMADEIRSNPEYQAQKESFQNWFDGGAVGEDPKTPLLDEFSAIMDDLNVLGFSGLTNSNLSKLAMGDRKALLVNGPYESEDIPIRDSIVRFSRTGKDDQFRAVEEKFADILKAHDEEGKLLPAPYVVLDPNQIKSATANSGEFSKTNPDIRFSLSGLSHLADQADEADRALANQKERPDYLKQFRTALITLNSEASRESPEFLAAQKIMTDAKTPEEIDRALKINTQMTTAQGEDEVLSGHIRKDNSSIIRIILNSTFPGPLQDWMLRKARHILAPIFAASQHQRVLFWIAERVYWNEKTGKMEPVPGLREFDKTTGTWVYSDDDAIPIDMAWNAFQTLSDEDKDALTKRAQKNEKFRQEQIGKAKPMQLAGLNLSYMAAVLKQAGQSKGGRAITLKKEFLDASNRAGQYLHDLKASGTITDKKFNEMMDVRRDLIDRLNTDQSGSISVLNAVISKYGHGIDEDLTTSGIEAAIKKAESNFGVYGYVHHQGFENPGQYSIGKAFDPEETNKKPWYESVPDTRKLRSGGSGFDQNLLRSDMIQVRKESKSAAENQWMKETEDVYGIPVEKIEKDDDGKMVLPDGYDRDSIVVAKIGKYAGKKIAIPTNTYDRYRNLLEGKPMDKSLREYNELAGWVDKQVRLINKSLLWHPGKFARDLFSVPFQLGDFLMDTFMQNPVEIIPAVRGLWRGFKGSIDPAQWKRLSPESFAEYSEAIGMDNEENSWLTDALDRVTRIPIGSTIAAMADQFNLAGAGDIPIKRIMTIAAETLADYRKIPAGIERDRFIRQMMNEYAFDTSDLPKGMMLARGNLPGKTSKVLGAITRGTVPFMGFAYRLAHSMILSPFTQKTWGGTLRKTLKTAIWMGIIAAIRSGLAGLPPEDESAADGIRNRPGINPAIRTASRLFIGSDDKGEYHLSGKGLAQLSFADTLKELLFNTPGNALAPDSVRPPKISFRDFAMENVTVGPMAQALMDIMGYSTEYAKNESPSAKIGRMVATMILPQAVRFGRDASKIWRASTDGTIADLKHGSFIEGFANQLGIPAGDARMDADGNLVITPASLEYLKMMGVNIKYIPYKLIKDEAEKEVPGIKNLSQKIKELTAVSGSQRKPWEEKKDENGTPLTEEAWLKKEGFGDAANTVSDEAARRTNELLQRISGIDQTARVLAQRGINLDINTKKTPEERKESRQKTREHRIEKRTKSEADALIEAIQKKWNMKK